MFRFTIRRILSYTDWIFDNPKSPSFKTKLWRISTKFFLCPRNRKLYDFQNYLPKFPLQKLEDTISKYLTSVRPLLSKEKYDKHEELARTFLQEEGLELQKELVIRHKSTDNYVSEYWTDYAYLAAGRRSMNPTDNTSPNPGLMINTSVALHCPFGTPQNFRQASRAASLSHLLMYYRYLIQTGNYSPFALPGTNLPLCSEQYRKLYNFTRVPSKSPLDRELVSPGIETGYVIVYNEGRYYKVDYIKDQRLVSPRQLEKVFLAILADDSPVRDADKMLPSFTAGDREVWADFREKYLSNGQNRKNMRYIDECAFVIVLDPEERYIGKIPTFIMDPEKNPYPKTEADHLSMFAASILHGNGHNRWMDKSINLVVFKTGLFGYTVEHTASDAPPFVQVVDSLNVIEMDYFVGTNYPVPLWVDRKLVNREKTRYNEQGYINDDSDPVPAVCTKLEWNFNEEAEERIITQAALTLGYTKSVQIKYSVFDRFGSFRMKELKMSPDAYVQLAIQLAYFKDQKEFALTYESGLTRLFKLGRTEAIRSLTEESCQFVRAMVEDEIDSYKAYKLLQSAGKAHAMIVKNAMVGKGFDRHLFALYITSKLKGENSEFLESALSIPYTISTSQVPLNQIGINKARPDVTCIGGGFGPVTKHGYGIAYFFHGDNSMAFHVTSFNESQRTDAVRFYNLLAESLTQIETICSTALRLTAAECIKGRRRIISYKDSLSFSQD
ncbi:Carnitine O-palmitoyltransferase 1, liver isoform-like [Oopsacas minuta]|uniref:Carnitine O-palmitoyltransferase 1, liver isoform-like n=1 Tax=Oopsacas minuta TaxID=111878 RepID=A0AAV7JPU8_9METZ|nr:Carnitine O-palmitoyltransferase 1, liver isoform-like [Oopsacas minuta]